MFDVIIDKDVHDSLETFYTIALRLHPTLNEREIEAKKDRLYHTLIHDLGTHPETYPPAEKQAWREKGYRELSAEDFRFGFRVMTDPETQERFVYVFAVLYGMNYHD